MTDSISIASTSLYLAIPLDQIVPSPYQARKDFDSDSLKALAESMKQEGLIEPIVVRRIGGPGSGDITGDLNVSPSAARSMSEVKYELISGERRLRAARILQWTSIEAKIIHTISEGEAAAKGLIENLQRENLNAVEEAEGFAELNRVDPAYWTQEKIGSVIGKSKTYICRSLALLSLPEPIKAELRQRNLSRDHAIELLRLKTSEDQIAMASQIRDRLTVKETRSLVESVLDGTVKIAHAATGTRVQPDPLKEVWRSLLANSSIAPKGAWQVNYGGKRSLGPKGPRVRGWTFWVTAPGVIPQSELSAWFRRMAEALDAQGPAIQPTLKILDREHRQPHLPSNEMEQSELENLVSKGPGAAYGWIFGNDSLTARKMASTSWSQLGVQDPIQSLRNLVQSLRQLQESEQAEK